MKTFSLYFFVNFYVKHYFKIELLVAKLFIYIDTLFVCTNTYLSLSFVTYLLCVKACGQSRWCGGGGGGGC
jgi:hypothetical protein